MGDVIETAAAAAHALGEALLWRLFAASFLCGYMAYLWSMWRWLP